MSTPEETVPEETVPTVWMVFDPCGSTGYDDDIMIFESKEIAMKVHAELERTSMLTWGIMEKKLFKDL